MAIEKYFDALGGPEAVFDPIPSFEGMWYISYENLIKNSKVLNGKNLFKEFMNKYYFEPLFAIFQTKFVNDFPVKLISVANDNLHGRCLNFSAGTFYTTAIDFLNFEIDKVNKTSEEQANYLNDIFLKGIEGYNEINLALSDALKLKAEKLDDIRKKEFNSEYFEAAMKDYAIFKNEMEFRTYIDIVYNITNQLKDGFLKLGDFFDTNINYEELYQAFDPDNFYLLCAVSLYDNMLQMEKDNEIVKNCNGYIEEYLKCSDKTSREEKNYNPKILYQMESGKKVRYTRRELQKDYEEFMKRHPEAKPLHLPPLNGEEKDKYRDINLMNKLTSLAEEDTRINWELLPKGEREKKEKNNEIKPLKDNNFKSVDVSVVNKRIEFLEGTGYVGKLKGLNTFTGYYGYVYSNGTVILEKFWEDEECIRPAINCATYIMNIDNFITMSKIAKINLIEYIKTLPEIGVKRLYHSNISNWERNIYKEINGAYRLEDAIEFINSLKSEGLNREQ